MKVLPSQRRFVLGALALAAAGAATAAPASAASGSTASCPAAAVSQPFAAWQDGADYLLAPGGDVEDGAAAWALAGGAAAVEGNESFQVGGATDHLSLDLPGASSATTAPMCVGVEHPTVRLFARRSSGPASGSLTVEAIFTDAAGNRHPVRIGSVTGQSAWAPTDPLQMIVNHMAVAQDNALQVALRFTPADGTRWSIDDVYVDPYRTG